MANIDDATVSLEELNLEESTANRHRKERKELQAKIQELKKSASKGDKKRKREVLEEIAKLEHSTTERHDKELNEIQFNIKNQTDVAAVDAAPKTNENNKIIETNGHHDHKNSVSSGIGGNGERITKAQKRRDKKALAEREKQAEILAQDEINKTGPRMMEIKTIKQILRKRNLQLQLITSDGDCLYNACIHQIQQTGRPITTTSTTTTKLDTKILRNLTADYILDNKNLLIFYMTNQQTGDCLTDTEFTKYCENIRSTPCWGGQIEIKAISNVLKVPIEVLQSTGPPTIQNDGNFQGPPLIITYHRFMFSLGEHYNSTTSLLSGENNEEIVGGDDDG